MVVAESVRKRPRHTFTMDDDVFELLTRLAEAGRREPESAARAVGRSGPRGV